MVVCSDQFWACSMRLDLLRALGCNSTAITVISSRFSNPFCARGGSPGLRGSVASSFHRFSLNPPSKPSSEPRNWSETFEAPSSSDVQEDFAFQEEQGSWPGPTPHKDIPKTLPTWMYGSQCPIPMSTTAQVWFLLTIFHQWMLSCVLTSLLKTTQSILDKPL